MASVSASRVEKLPPALPAKQHRTHSLSHSSADSDCVVLSPVGVQHQTYVYNDVFPEPNDCNAAQCPIHQRYDPLHQVRFFSDNTPPPVPKKRLTRTSSLPGTNASLRSPRSPLSPLQRHARNFDNPLYMLAPITYSHFHQETEEVKPARRSPVPSLSLSQLSFDTQDKHLSYIFGSLKDQRVVSQGIQQRHLYFLRSMAKSIEAEILLQAEAADKDVSSYQPQDFLLKEGSQPKQTGDAVYHSLYSPKFPGRVLGLRVLKQTEDVPWAHTEHQASHVNVQNVVAHFQPSNTQRNDSSRWHQQDSSIPLKSDCTAATSSDGASIEYATDPTNINLTSVRSLLQKGHSVTVERDLPHLTLEDFVQDSSSLQGSDCLVYDRQVCVLLLQILMGSQHLYNFSATAAELRPREISLVWHGRERDGGENKPEQDASEIKRNFKTSEWREEVEWEKSEKKGRVQMLWRLQGSPRVVLSPQASAASAPQLLTSIKSQIGDLIQYCLAPEERSTSLDSDPSLSKSSYRRGLLHLSSLLQSGNSRPQIADMVVTLQMLLWGPSFPLFSHGGATTTAVHNWLTIKRALLVMKLADRGLTQDQSVLDWEDLMCMQYLSFTEPETVVSLTSQLWSTLKMDWYL